MIPTPQILAQVGAGGPARPAPFGGLSPEDLWLPALILLALFLYWLWLRRAIPRIGNRRDIIRAGAVHLLCALALNIAVAWTAALLATGILQNGLAMPWVGAGPNPRSPEHVALFRGWGGPALRTYVGLFDDGQLMHDHLVLHAGFPLPAFAGAWHDPEDPGVPSATYVLFATTPGEMTGGARVPLRPLPIGFLLNTLFYALVLALPLARFSLRRRLRLHRGQCPACGYNLSGLNGAPCPECGGENPTS